MDVTDNNDKGVTETEAAETKQSAGQLLRAARLVRGMSIEDVARQLRLSIRQITALEEDDYAKLSGDTFLRGFVRNYAKLVQLDATSLLQLLPQSLLPVRQISAHRTEAAPLPSDQKPGGHNLIIAGVVVVALLFLIYEIYRGNETARQPATQVATEAEAEIEQTMAQSQIHLPSVILSDGADPVQPAAEAAVVQQENNNPSPPVQQATVAVAAPDPANKGEGILRFAFVQESWVEIKDGAGKMIFSQLNPAGSEQIIRGKMPLSVVIGNAASVKLVYNNKPVNLAPYTNTNGGVAHLSLE